MVFPTIAAPWVPLINGGYRLMGKGPTYPKGMGRGNPNPAQKQSTQSQEQFVEPLDQPGERHSCGLNAHNRVD